MNRQPSASSDFLRRLAAIPEMNGADTLHLPSLIELSKEMGVSVASLREQLEVARALGLVDVRPRTGIRRLPYSFLPAVRQSLQYAMTLDQAYFDAYAELRNHLEAAFWHEAVRRLDEQDKQALGELMASAWSKLRNAPVQIPHAEHRQLHLAIFSKLGNPFVLGILEAYWEAYEAVGLNLYADYQYLQQVWQYHQQMVDSICSGEYETGLQALVAHKDLLAHRPTMEAAPADRGE